MKVLYVSHASSYPSGWGRAAVDYILAMDSVGIDVVARSVKLNDSKSELPYRYLELESKSSHNSDVVIQHVLPHHLKYDGSFKKNIALCVYENGGEWLHNWNSKINMMDELWVPSTFTKSCFVKGGVTIPIKIVPHTFDMSRYEKTYDKISDSELDGNYIFYTIADVNIRKNLMKMVQAFHREFTINEPVSLVIKCSKFGVNPEELYNSLKQDCEQVRQHMKMYTNESMYKSEFFITIKMSDDQIMDLHNTGNCYVNTSHGEAWCIPMFDALAMGNQIVCPDDMYDYLKNVKCASFKTYEDISFRNMDTFKEIGSARETWQEASSIDIGEAMRHAYNCRNIHRPEVFKSAAARYSYSEVGNQIKGMLDGSAD